MRTDVATRLLPVCRFRSLPHFLTACFSLSAWWLQEEAACPSFRGPSLQKRTKPADRMLVLFETAAGYAIFKVRRHVSSPRFKWELNPLELAPISHVARE